jgi:uncharacterized RDD family membrane protein YckC
MGCPQCQSEEISSSGTCLICGYQLNPDPPAAESPAIDQEVSNYSGMIEMDYAGNDEGPSQREEMPPWRQELSQRLQAIKQKRELPGPAANSQPEAAILPVPDQPPADGPLAAPVPKPAEKPPFPKPAPKPSRPVDAGPERPRIPPPPRPRQKTLQPLELEPFSAKPAQKTADPGEVQKLIDSVVSRQSGASPASFPEISIAASGKTQQPEGKLILLSRTLSGLIDLIFIVLCAGGFIIASDFFSGIVFLDPISLAGYSALFLLTYFFYSIFFLAACGQTIGMMITDLRVVGSDNRRSSVRQLFGWCLGYLVSLLGLGIGLLWSLFDGESRCFHDRISNTRVIRIQDQLGF